MYSLMIVEDELLARLALKNSIKWEKYNINTIMEARDGMEALEKFKASIPDILIVDINIPIMNGMELIKEIRKVNKESKIIILSCLEDFKYATEAIKEGVSEYILKASMSIEEIEVAIKKLVEELHKKENIPLHKKKNQKEEEYKQKNTLLRKLLSGEYKETEAEKEIFFKAYILACFKVEFVAEKTNDLSQELLNKMNFVKNIIASGIQGEYSCHVILLPGEYYIAYVEENENKKNIFLEEIAHLLENTAHLIQKYTSASVIVGVSDRKEGQNTIFESLRLAKRRLGYHVFLEETLYMKDDEKVLEELEKRWRSDIQTIKEETSIFQITEDSDYLESWPEFSDSYLENVQNYWISIMNRISFLLEGKKGIDISGEAAEFSRRIRNCGKQKESKDLFQTFLRKIERIQEETKRYSPVVEQAIAYIRKNYNKPITLADAAVHIAISPNYLSLVFHKEYGINFTEYVIQLRIEKAKILLGTTNQKLYEIAEQCGFNEHTYFTKTFKKQEGMSPNEYKKKITGRFL